MPSSTPTNKVAPTNNGQQSQTDWGRLVGHHGVRRQLERALIKGALPHALLLVGSSGIGKMEIARALAALRVSLPTKDSSETQTSAETQRTLARVGNHPDIHFLSREPEKKDIAVDAVRELCANLRLKPYYGTASVCIINDAHELSIAAANALLLTLEEPPPHAAFILISDSPQRLPPTVISRCQAIYCGGLSKEEIKEVLSHISPELTEALKLPLLNLCADSVAPLGLNSFVSPKTGKPLDAAAVTQHLEKLSLESLRVVDTIKRFFALNPSPPAAGDALSTASMLANILEENIGLQPWQLLHSVIRENMTKDPGGRFGAWADLLVSSLNTEKLIKERNVNSTLYLSELLLQHS